MEDSDGKITVSASSLRANPAWAASSNAYVACELAGLGGFRSLEPQEVQIEMRASIMDDWVPGLEKLLLGRDPYSCTHHGSTPTQAHDSIQQCS